MVQSFQGPGTQRQVTSVYVQLCPAPVPIRSNSRCAPTRMIELMKFAHVVTSYSQTAIGKCHSAGRREMLL